MTQRRLWTAGNYVDNVWKYVALFRQGGFTMPWAEGYIYLSPGVGTQQMNVIRQDMFRAGVRDIVRKEGHWDGRILYYVMSVSATLAQPQQGRA